MHLLYMKRLKKSPIYHWKYHILPWDTYEPTEKDSAHNFTSFQNIFMRQLEAIKGFAKIWRTWERNQGFMRALNCKESSSLTLELLKNRASTLKKTDWKICYHKFSAETTLRKSWKILIGLKATAGF